MKRPASHRSLYEAALPSVAAELASLCTHAAQLHNAIGNQYYHDVPSPLMPTEEQDASDAVEEHALATKTMQHYQLASEMLLLAEEYRDPSSSACAGLVDTASQNAETSLNFMMDYVADLEEEYNHSLLMPASSTKPCALSQQGTPLPFTLTTSPNEQAAAVFYNMSLVCVLLGNEDRAVDFLAMVEELCQDSSSSSPATGSSAMDSSCQVRRVEPEEATPDTATNANANGNDRRPDLELLALSVVSSANVSSPPDKDKDKDKDNPSQTGKVRVVDTGTLLQVGRSHAIRSNKSTGAEDGGTDPLLSCSCSVPTVLPSYEKDAFAIAGIGKGGKHPVDGSECSYTDDEDDCLSQASEPYRRRSTVI